MQSPSSSNPKKILASDDVFEINDFTVVTDFEVLILSLENAIQELTTEVDNFDEQKVILTLKFYVNGQFFLIEIFVQ
jgi:hypothetical protein